MDEIELSLSVHGDQQQVQQWQKQKAPLLELSPLRSLSQLQLQDFATVQPPTQSTTHGACSFDVASVDSCDTYASCNTHPFNSLLDLTIIEAAPVTNVAHHHGVSGVSPGSNCDAKNGYLNPFDCGGSSAEMADRPSTSDGTSCQATLRKREDTLSKTSGVSTAEYSIATSASVSARASPSNEQQQKHVVIVPGEHAHRSAAEMQLPKKRFVHLYVWAIYSRSAAKHDNAIELDCQPLISLTSSCTAAVSNALWVTLQLWPHFAPIEVFTAVHQCPHNYRHCSCDMNYLPLLRTMQ